MAKIPIDALMNLGIGIASKKWAAQGGGDSNLAKIELKENDLLRGIARQNAELIQQQGVTNVILMRILEEQDPEAAKEVMEQLEQG